MIRYYYAVISKDVIMHMASYIKNVRPDASHAFILELTQRDNVDIFANDVAAYFGI
jgi:hypothetical protein